jgi:hypothetical protein
VILGTLGSPHRASAVAGSVLRLPGGLELAWWIGAEDRWHVPSQEITVRHALVGSAPVLRTAVRVPGGDAVATVAAMRQGTRDLAVLDIANESPNPFAVAFVLGGPGLADVRIDGSVVRVAGRPVLTLARPPQLVASVPAGGDLLAALQERTAGPTLSDDHVPASVAVIVPVTHRTRVRSAVLIGADHGAAATVTPVHSALRDPATVAEGWNVHVNRAPLVDVPDPAVGQRLRGLVASLLLAADEIGTADRREVAARLGVAMSLARALAATGLDAEAARLVGAVDGLQRGRGDIGDADSAEETALALAALCERVLLARDPTDDRAAAVAAAPVVAGGLEYLQRRARRTPLGGWGAVFALGAALFDVAGEQRAALAARRVWERDGSPWPVPSLPLPPLPASSSGADLLPSDPLRLVDEVLRLVDGLVRRGPDGSLALLASCTAAWEGQSIDVRGVPTPSGPLSFSVRWHGSRPALLWECARPVVLTCPALDPAFRGSGPSGDALLRR